MYIQDIEISIANKNISSSFEDSKRNLENFGICSKSSAIFSLNFLFAIIKQFTIPEKIILKVKHSILIHFKYTRTNIQNFKKFEDQELTDTLRDSKVSNYSGNDLEFRHG